MTETQHTGAGRPAGSSNKPEPEFDLAFIAAPQAAPTELVRTSAPARERSAAQQAMDKVVPGVHAEWIKRGRPSAWNKLPVVTYYVQPNKVDGIKTLIRKACELHNVRPRYGANIRVTEAVAKKFNIDPKYVGTIAVSWAAMDKRERTADKTDKPAAAPAAPAAPAPTPATTHPRTGTSR